MSNASQSNGATDSKLAPNAGRLSQALHGKLVDTASKFQSSRTAMKEFIASTRAAGKRVANISKDADPEFYYELVRASYEHLKDQWSDKGLTEAEKADFTNADHPGMYSVRYVLDTDRKDLPDLFKDKSRCNGRDIREVWQDEGYGFFKAYLNGMKTEERKLEAASNPDVAQSHDALLSHKDLVKALRRHNKGAAKDMPIHSSAFYNAAVKELKRLHIEFRDHVPAIPEDL